MKPYKLVHETPDHFVLHDGEKHFHVARKGLDEKTIRKIKSFAAGGELSKKELISEHKEIVKDLSGAKHQFEKQKAELEEYQNKASGGKLDANARAHIAPHNFALPGGRYPIEDENHARNALARVSQHGSPEEKAKVRAAVHRKYPGIEQSKAEGGEIGHDKENLKELDSSMHQFLQEEAGEKLADGGSAIDQLQDSVNKAFKVQKKADGGEVEDSGILDKLSKAIREGFEGPTPTPKPTLQDKNEEIRRKAHLSVHDPSNPEGYAMGGDITNPAKVHSIAHESQSEAIRRYADGNPANLSKGGAVHHNVNQGKNTLHFHFYDGGSTPTPLDKEIGNIPNPGPAPTPLDQYVNLAEGTPDGAVEDAAAQQAVPSDSEKLASAAQEIQQGIQGQEAMASTAAPQPPGAPPISPQQQISVAPKPQAPAPDQSPNLLSDVNKYLAGESEAIKGLGEAQAQEAQQKAQVIENYQKIQADADAKYQAYSNQITAQNEKLYNDVYQSKIDPNHFWADKSTGSKIAAGIAVILGGLSGGITGRGDNPGLAMIQSRIQQDIDAQKEDRTGKLNLYKIGLEKYRDEEAAHQYATLHANTILQAQLAKVAANTASQSARLIAQQNINQLGLQNAGLRADLALKQAAYGAMGSGGAQPRGVNPDKVRLLTAAGVIPKEEVSIVDKEVGEYQKLNSHLDEADQVFKDAAKNATYTERVAQALPLGSHIPTTRDTTKSYLAQTNAFLDKLTKDITGRVTPQSMENLRHSIPVAGDSEQVLRDKANAVKDIIREAYSFPTLQKYRLLNPNDAAITSNASRQKRFREGPPKK